MTEMFVTFDAARVE